MTRGKRLGDCSTLAAECLASAKSYSDGNTERNAAIIVQSDSQLIRNFIRAKIGASKDIILCERCKTLTSSL